MKSAPDTPAFPNRSLKPYAMLAVRTIDCRRSGVRVFPGGHLVLPAEAEVAGMGVDEMRRLKKLEEAWTRKRV